MNGQKVQLRFGGPITPVLKVMMITCGSIFLIQQIMEIVYPGFLEVYFGLSYLGFFNELRIWQIATYMFLHGGWFHILFNLIGLWMFAGELESLWGSRRFLFYYLLTGIGAGVFILLMNYYVYAQYRMSPITIGASGAIYGILLAYGVTWPNRKVLLYFVIPVKIKYLVMVFGLIEFFGTLSSVSDNPGNISHIGHLGGLITGAIYLLGRSRFFQTKAVSSRLKKASNPLTKKIHNAKMEKKRKEIQTRIKAKEIIDMLLEKIAREGMNSLNAEERRMLEWARKNYYPEEKETMH
jgi:membrane associated rhomboid family serine protease